jgi:hypothetical protein
MEEDVTMATVAIGKIESIEGSVEVVHADGSKGTLEQGAVVFSDDSITTGENSSIKIAFLDGTSMHIDSESTATLDKDVIDPALIQENDGSSLIVLDASGRAITPDSGHNTVEKIGVVETARGVVEGIGDDGVVRVLEAGDALYSNDVIRVGDDGNVSIRMVDGSDLSFGPGITARMDDSGFSSPSQIAGITDPAEIHRAILEGRDPSEEATAPVAGETDSNEGGLPVLLTPSDRTVTPDSGLSQLRDVTRRASKTPNQH